MEEVGLRLQVVLARECPRPMFLYCPRIPGMGMIGEGRGEFHLVEVEG